MSLYTLRVELLEDLHTGTGQGSLSLDALQFRDRQGRPAVAWTHLKGVLAETARRGALRGLCGEGLAQSLFGWDPKVKSSKPSAGCVRLGTARLASGATGGTLVLTASARQPHNRKPLDDTLRTGEWMHAGTVLAALCQVPDEAKADFELLVRATVALGADRTRGALVRMQLAAATPFPLPTLQDCSQGRPGKRLRLLLRALEPLSFPDNPRAGNIVGTRNAMPGRTLLGALVQSLRNAKPALAQRLVDGQ